MARASDTPPPVTPKKTRPKRRLQVTEFPDNDEEFFDEDDLAVMVGVNRRAFHDLDGE